MEEKRRLPRHATLLSYEDAVSFPRGDFFSSMSVMSQIGPAGISRPGARPSPRSIQPFGAAASPLRPARATSTTPFLSPPGLSRADRDGGLAAFLKPELTPPERTLA
jgi:hypothetical protein